MKSQLVKITTDENVAIIEFTKLKHFTKNGALILTPLLNFSHITDNNGSQIGNNTTMTHENQNFKTVNDFNMSMSPIVSHHQNFFPLMIRLGACPALNTRKVQLLIPTICLALLYQLPKIMLPPVLYHSWMMQR